MSKKIKLIIGIILGVFAAIYIFLVIHTNYISPPKAGNDHLTTKEWADRIENKEK